MRNPMRGLPAHWLLVAGVAATLAIPTTIVSTTADQTTTPSVAPSGAVAGQASTARIGAPTRVRPAVSDTPYRPTKAQRVARTKAMAGLAKHVAPSMGTHTTAADVRGAGGPETVASSQATGSLTQLRKTLINSTCVGCGQSTINEPSVANNGKFVVETSNWNIAYSTNGGVGAAGWHNLDPYSFSSGFCCDQQVVYDPTRNIFLMLQLDYAGEGNASNGLALSVASGKTPTSWCTYKFSGAIGGGTTDTPDFPKIALANDNAYLTWNDYPPNAGFARSGLARMPLDSLAACAGFGFSFLTRTTEFTFALAGMPSSLDTFYWVSNWFLDGTANGSNMRIFSWPENSGTFFNTTRAINAYTFGNASCGSPNWCSRLDPRWESAVITRAEYRGQANSAFAGDTLLQVATSAGPSGFSNGKNYVVYNYFKLNSLTYIGNDQTYSTTTNFAYPGCSVNNEGHVGCAMADGTNVPGGLVMLQDDVNPTQPWATSFLVGGVSGATGWGDYVVTSPWNPAVGPFQTVLWQVNGATVQPYYIVWGRTSDLNGFNRWKTS